MAKAPAKDTNLVTLWLVGKNSYNLNGGGEDGGFLRVKRGESAQFSATKAKELLKLTGVVHRNGSPQSVKAFSQSAEYASDVLGYDVTKGVAAKRVLDESEMESAPVMGKDINTTVPPAGAGMQIG